MKHEGQVAPAEPVVISKPVQQPTEEEQKTVQQEEPIVIAQPIATEPDQLEASAEFIPVKADVAQQVEPIAEPSSQCSSSSLARRHRYRPARFHPPNSVRPYPIDRRARPHFPPGLAFRPQGRLGTHQSFPIQPGRPQTGGQ